MASKEGVELSKRLQHCLRTHSLYDRALVATHVCIHSRIDELFRNHSINPGHLGLKESKSVPSYIRTNKDAGKIIIVSIFIKYSRFSLSRHL